MDRFECDSVLFPINPVCYAQGDFGPRLVQHARQKGVALLAMKVLARSQLPKGVRPPSPKVWYQPVQDRELAARAMAFALGEQAVAVLPPGDPDLYRMALELSAEVPTLTAQQREDLLKRTEGEAPLFTSKQAGG